MERSKLTIPTQGVDENYDAAEADLQAADRQLKDFLKEVRAKLGAGKDVAYVAVNKETHLIEIPEVPCILPPHTTRSIPVPLLPSVGKSISRGVQDRAVSTDACASTQSRRARFTVRMSVLPWEAGRSIGYALP